MSVLSNAKIYEGNERPPYGQPDILLPKFRCDHCDKNLYRPGPAL